MDNQQDTTKTGNTIAETQPTASTSSYHDRKNELHSKIMKVTMTIKEEHPELSKFLDEMPETIPNEKDPEIVLMDLKKYFDSLSDILAKYKVEHSAK
jgi:hypothetical protein